MIKNFPGLPIILLDVDMELVGTCGISSLEYDQNDFGLDDPRRTLIATAEANVWIYHSAYSILGNSRSERGFR